MKSQNKRPKGQNPAKTLKRLMGIILKNYTPHCIVVLLCIFGSAFVSVKGTLFMQTLIDDYILPLTSQSNPDFRPLGMAIMKLALFFVAGALMTYTYNRIMVNVSQGTMKKIRIDVFTHMESLPIKYFDTHAHGDIMSIYTNDIDTLRQMISQSIPQLVNSAATIVSVLISMIILNIPLTILTLIMVAIMVLTTGKVAGKAGSYFMKQQKSIGELNGFIEEMMEGQKVVKVFCHEEESIKDFNKLNEQLFDSANNANAFANILMPINVNLGNLSYVACAILGSILAISGVTSLTLGALASFLQLNKSFSHPISQVSQQLNSIIMALAGAERVFSLLDEKPEVDNGYVTLVNATEDEEGNIKECEEHTGIWAWKHPHGDGTVTLTKLLGDVTFNDVDFGYNEEKTILHNIKLYAEPGQKVAFVGSTGAGKTTITNLINRFYDIQDGKIKYDGININKIKKADLRRSLGIVLQDTHLFTGTVADNIRYGNLNATDEEVAKAAKLANADGFIERLPQGYDTMIGEGGCTLSGGEKQRISIARAILKDAPVILLDEATASLDPENEVEIQYAINSLIQGRTVIVIAHKLKTISDADKIIVLDGGNIIEQGTHEQLLKDEGLYAHLWDIQEKSCNWKVNV